jgi:Xaa-Pro aminopeptidase
VNRADEVRSNVAALQALLGAQGLDALVLARHGNAAWLAAGGRTYVNRGAERGEGWFVVTPRDVALLTSNIEGGRLMAEEFAGLPWRLVTYPWWEGPAQALAAMLQGAARVGADAPVPGLSATTAITDIADKLVELRSTLSKEAQARARTLGRVIGRAVAGVARELRVGETEHEIARRLQSALVSRGMDVPVALVGVDDRLFRWRHFLPTQERLEKYAALVVCARQDGLTLSCTRLVHFGTPSPAIMGGLAAVHQVDAALIAATRPGAAAGALFGVAQNAYAEAGFPDEWQNHHQGGMAGYEPREWTALPGAPQVVQAGQLYAWNPTVPGAKSEDTILVGPAANEILTDSGDFPYISVQTGGAAIRRPAILIR